MVKKTSVADLSVLDVELDSDLLPVVNNDLEAEAQRLAKHMAGGDDVKELVSRAGSVFNFDGVELEPEQKLFLVALTAKGTISGACRAVGVSYHTVQKWKKDPKFLDFMEQATEVIADTLEEAAYQRALEGSDRLLIMLLRALRPRKYADRKEVSGPEGGPVAVDFVTLVQRASEDAPEDETESE